MSQDDLTRRVRVLEKKTQALWRLIEEKETWNPLDFISYLFTLAGALGGILYLFTLLGDPK